MAYSAAQQKEIDRMNSELVAPTKDKDGNALITEIKDTLAAKIQKSFEQMTPDQLKARCNIAGVGSSVNFSAENNYTQAEQDDIKKIISKDQNQWGRRVAHVLPQIAAMRTAGTDESVITAIIG